MLASGDTTQYSVIYSNRHGLIDLTLGARVALGRLHRVRNGQFMFLLVDIIGNNQMSRHSGTSTELVSGARNDYSYRSNYWILGVRFGPGFQMKAGRVTLITSLSALIVATEEGSWSRHAEVIPVLFKFPMLRVGYQWTLG